MKKVGVLGTGTMGAGIIQVLALNGYEVVMRARRDSSVEKGLATVKKNLDKMVAKEKIAAEAAEEAYSLSLIHISEPTRQAEISYAVFCLKKKSYTLPSGSRQ